ncbi:MAG: zf-HC2 domain-containing protein [Ktedonobacterales bacterium]
MTVGGYHKHSDWEQRLEELSAYLDSELDETERATLEQHLSTCEECRRALEELRQTRALLRALPEPALPRSFRLPETGAVPESISRGRGGTAASYRVERVWPLRALQYIGGMVAVLGLFILITAALQSPHMTSSAASPSLRAPAANSSSTDQASQTRPAPLASPSVESPISSQAGVATQSPVATTPTGYGPSLVPSNGTLSNPLPLDLIAGAALAIGGGGFFVTGTVLIRRRSRVRSLREPSTPVRRTPHS